VESLEASLRVVLPWLDEALVPAAAARQLLRVAGKLAPVHCAGFEVRLADHEPAVDLVQRIRGLRGEPERLSDYIESSSLAHDPIWERVRGFCRRWSRPNTPIHRLVAGGFLGFDAETAVGETPSPSVYLSLEPGGSVAPGTLMRVIEEASALLRGQPLSEEVAASLRRCREGCPEGAAITDVGLMLSRDIDAVRLVIAPVARAAIEDFLAARNWLGGPPEIRAAVALIPEEREHVAVSLDVGAKIFPRVGLEYYPGPLDTDLPLWTSALDALVGAGLCSETKRDALLRWPGYIEPVETEDPWPSSLLVDSLLNRPDRFMVLARRLTFLKLVCRPDAEPEAKAYFGFGPRSFTAVDEDGEDTDTAAPSGGRGAAVVLASADRRLGSSATSAAAISKVDCQAAIDAAAGFLMAHRTRGALWLEFPRILEGTDEWASAYIGLVLASAPGGKYRAAAHETWNRLCEHRGADDGWGYNGGLPQDADSTLWALRLARALNEQHADRARSATRVLERHVLSTGGVATYELVAEPGLRGVMGSADLGGMYVAHVCVSAAVAALDGFGERMLPFLVGRQEDDGRWRGYWWSDDEYTTALAVGALAGREDPACTAAARRAREWAANRFDRSGAVWSRTLGASSAFATGLCAEVLLLTADGARGGTDHETNSGATLSNALAWLLDAQLDDGSWAASALMRMPSTDAVDGDERPASTTVSVDDRALFTTATVVRTLTRAIASGL